MSKKLLLILLLPLVFFSVTTFSYAQDPKREAFTVNIFGNSLLPELNIMPPGWQEGLWIWSPDFCARDEAPRIVEGPRQLVQGEAAEWSLAGGCVDNSTWRNPPIENGTRWPDRPQGVYFTRQVCSIASKDPLQPSLRKDTSSSDRFLAFEVEQGAYISTYSQQKPVVCAFSSQELDGLSSGEHTLQVFLEAVRATQKPLGGWRVEAYASTEPTEQSVSFDAPLAFQVEVFPSGSGTVASLDERIDCPPLCQTRYPKGTEVQLRAEPASIGWTFSRWTSPDSPDVCGDACEEAGTPAGGVADVCGSNPRCLVDTNVIRKVRAEFIKTSRILSVYTEGEGRVVSSPEGIDCGSSCEAAFPIRSQVELRAESSPGWYFAGWQEGCQSEDETCSVQMSEDRTARALFRKMEPPTIFGPEVINPSADNPSRQQWRVQLRGRGPVICEVREQEVYVGDRDVEEDIAGDLRRWQSDCSEGRQMAEQEFITPLFWQGCFETGSECFEEESSADDLPENPIREFNGRIESLPDGQYILIIRQLWIDDNGKERGYAEAEKEFWLDRMKPEIVDIEAKDQEALPNPDGEQGYISWPFVWGEDLTQTGPRQNDNGQADVRCEIVSEATGSAIENFASGWGECREGAMPNSDGQLVGGLEGAGEVLIPETLPDGKYFLDIYQRDRINDPQRTRVPFFQLRTAPENEETGKDLLRFGARWQSIFVASTRPPAPSEGVIGDAWHPLRCGRGGSGLLHLCLADGFSASPEDLDPEQIAAAEPDLFWDRSLPLKDSAQGYFRMATPGRFETSRSERRYAHIRLLPQVRNKNNTEEIVPLCSPWQNSADPLFDPSSCTDQFPVSRATVQLRGSDITLQQNSGWNRQNSITGNSELHICTPGVPRALSSSRPAPDGRNIVDIWDGQNGALVTNSNSNSLLGTVPDEDCSGYVFYWKWNSEQISNLYRDEQPDRPSVYSGPATDSEGPVCQASAPRESSVPAPQLDEISDEATKIGSYRWSTPSYQFPYHSSAGTPRWEAGGGVGDPFIAQTAPWNSPVVCAEGGYLSPRMGEWRLADIQAARSGRLRFLQPRKIAGAPAVAEPGFARNHFALPPQEPYGGSQASNLDGNPNNLEEEWVVSFKLEQPTGFLARWFMDARYYGYHLQRWAYQADVASAKRWISVFAPRSSR